MDRMFKDWSEQLFEQECSVIRTGERTLVINGGARAVEDQGDPILNYRNYTVLGKNASRTIGWDGNRDFLTTYYPITREWFAVREGKTEKSQEESRGKEEENSEVENLKNRIRIIEAQHKDEVNRLRKEKNILQSMLKKALKVCEAVKKSPIGKIFFRGKLKELPEEPNIDDK